MGSRLHYTARCPSGLLDLAALDAGGAHLDLLDTAIDENPCGLEVGLPYMLGVPGRVTHPVANGRTFAADIAFPGHDCSKSDGFRIYG